MKEYDLFIPLFYNDGTPIEPVKIQVLQARLLEFFNGVTFFPQPNQGLAIRWSHLSRRNRHLSRGFRQSSFGATILEATERRVEDQPGSRRDLSDRERRSTIVNSGSTTGAGRREFIVAILSGICKFLGKFVFVKKHPPLLKTLAFFDKSECWNEVGLISLN